MPSLRAVQLPAIEEEPDTSVEAVVVAAIRLHECIEASLRRLAAEDVHATSDRNAPAGLGADWICQLLPFHRSTSVLRGVPCGVPPTAVHADGDVHDTPLS